jgi:hypothetical protein
LGLGGLGGIEAFLLVVELVDPFAFFVSLVKGLMVDAEENEPSLGEEAAVGAGVI